MLALLLGFFPLQPLVAATVDYQSTVVVSPVGTQTQNGTALTLALNGITASAANPVLLKIEPGTYDVGSNRVTIQSHLDIEGSGRGLTTLRGTVGVLPTDQRGVVVVSDQAELRSLTVVNETTDESGDSAAVLAHPGSRVADVAAIALENPAGSLHRAILVTPPNGVVALPVLTNVEATAVGRAVQVFAPGLEAENLIATGAESFAMSSGLVSLRNSVLSGSLWIAPIGTAHFVSSQLDGPLSCPSGICTCVASYDGDFRELSAACNSCGSADWCR